VGDHARYSHEVDEQVGDDDNSLMRKKFAR
jgi:hypothetical protein